MIASACSLSCGPNISTAYLSRSMNGAVAFVATAGQELHFFTSNVDGRTTEARNRNCTSEHRIEVREHQCAAASGGLQLFSATNPLLASITSALPHRRCIDLLNYRGNGPEDARVLPLVEETSAVVAMEHQALLLYVDYAKRAGGSSETIGHMEPQHDRRMHYRILKLMPTPRVHAASGSAAQATWRALLSPVRCIEPASPDITNLTTIEKNWAPFSVAEGPHKGVYVQHWLDNGFGITITLRLDVRTGLLMQRYEDRITPSLTGGQVLGSFGARSQRLAQISDQLALVSGQLARVSRQLSKMGTATNQGRKNPPQTAQEPWLPAGTIGRRLSKRSQLTPAAVLDTSAGANPGTASRAAAHPSLILQHAMGAASHATISGGTPALRLNSSHFLAIGHTMTWTCNQAEVRAKGKAARAKCMKRNRWRAYAMFAYTFSAVPNFGLRSVSREFRMRLPGQGLDRLQQRADAPSRISGHASARPMLDVDEALLWPPPPVHALHSKLRGVDGKPQFPVGLSWANEATGSDPLRRCVRLSWGHDDVETYVSMLPLRHLLAPAMTTVLE